MIKAYAEGKDLQYRRTDGVWVDDTEPSFPTQWPQRIKPEPREWWDILNMNGEIVQRYSDYSSALGYRDAKPKSYNLEIIHVREVL